MVTTSDSLTAAMGLATDAPEAIPQAEEVGIPDGYDANAPEDGFADEAATDADDTLLSDDPDADPALRSELEAQLRTSIEAELKAAYATKAKSLENQLVGLQNKVGRVQSELERSTFREQARSHWLNNYFEENGLDKRDLHVLENTLTQAERKSETAQAQVTGAFTESVQQLFANHQARLREMAFKDGQQLFDPNDAEIQQAFLDGIALVRRHHGEDRGRPDSPYQAQAASQFERLKSLMYAKREQALIAGTVQKRQQDATRQQKARATQKTRGVQNISRGGAAAPASFTDVLNQVKTEAPDLPYAEQFEAAVRRQALTQPAQR